MASVIEDTTGKAGELFANCQCTRLPGASRAVSNAVGANPVAMLIPCHRVIQKSGALGGYRWGSAKKEMLQAWELLCEKPIEV